MNEIDYSKLPIHMRGGLQRYFEYGIKPGSFLTAIIENDLIGAVQNADESNIKLLPHYAIFLVSQAPRGSYGSKTARLEWQAQFADSRRVKL